MYRGAYHNSYYRFIHPVKNERLYASGQKWRTVSARKPGAQASPAPNMEARCATAARESSAKSSTCAVGRGRFRAVQSAVLGYLSVLDGSELKLNCSEHRQVAASVSLQAFSCTQALHIRTYLAAIGRCLELAVRFITRY